MSLVGSLPVHGSLFFLSISMASSPEIIRSRSRATAQSDFLDCRASPTMATGLPIRHEAPKWEASPENVGLATLPDPISLLITREMVPLPDLGGPMKTPIF